jgi:hypothetical protein
MKTLNLQAAIAGAPIQDFNGKKLNFVVYVPEAKNHEQFVYLDANGNICATEKDTSNIFMAPVFKKYWVNVDKRFSGEPYCGTPFDNEAEAMRDARVTGGYLKTISFDIEE